MVALGPLEASVMVRIHAGQPLQENGRQFKDVLPPAPRAALLKQAAEMSESKVNNSRNGKATKALIYVVDDEPMLLELAAVILEPLGYRVKTFRDPQSALQSFADARPRPALLITDYA